MPTDLIYLTPPEDSRSNPPVFVFAPDGILWMAWPSYQQGQFKMALSSLSDGKWSSPSYPDSGSTDQVEPQLLVDSFKNPVLVYASYDGHQWFVKRAVRTGQGWDEPEVFGQGLHPSAVMAKGRLWLAWEREGQIYLNPDGEAKNGGTLQTIKPEHSSLYYSSSMRFTMTDW